MGLFHKSGNRIKDVLFVMNLFLIILTIPMPFILSIIEANNLKAIFGVPFFHIPIFSAIIVKETGNGMGIWFFILFFSIVLFVLCSAILARLVNRKFSLIVYLFVIVDMLPFIYLSDFICLLWGIAIIVLTTITRKEYIWYKEKTIDTQVKNA